MSDEFVVIGAGICGLAAARRLANNACRVIVLEARDRIGGRLFTYRPPDGSGPLELGAQVVHGRLNPLHAQPGLALRRLGYDAEARVLHRRTLTDFGTFGWAVPPLRLEALLAVSRPDDVSVADWLRRLPIPGAGGDAHLEWFRQQWAADADVLSTAGVASALAHDAALGAGDFAVQGGFAALASLLAEGLTVKTDCPVAEISLDARQIRVTAPGLTLTPAAVIVTVPPSVISAGGLRIAGLPAERLAALPALASGDGFCAVVRAGRVAPESAVVFDADGVGGFLSCTAGSAEVLLVAKGAAAARLRAAFAAPRVLADLITAAFPWSDGSPLTPAAVADWGRDPWSAGAFSWPHPDRRRAAEMWSAPVDGRLFFAGEAFSDRPGRVHSAFESGVRAADHLMESS